jgi:DNA-binding Xre family transcriptional regulator
MVALSPFGDYAIHMGTEEAAVSAATLRNIKLGLVDKDLTKNALAVRAGIASSTFNRKLNSPTDFTLRELGQVAKALDLKLEDIIRDVAA